MYTHNHRLRKKTILIYLNIGAVKIDKKRVLAISGCLCKRVKSGIAEFAIKRDFFEFSRRNLLVNTGMFIVSGIAFYPIWILMNIFYNITG